MNSATESDQNLEIAHVLIMDVVQYSQLLITEQTSVMRELTQTAKSTPRFQQAESENKLVRIPTGDGVALVFFDNPQSAIECAMEVAKALKDHPRIRLRMGIHSGPVNRVVDVSERSNVAGAGIDLAQRVMDCGDAGHILLSKRAADDLSPLPRWNPYLHDLGECEVKHGRKISLVNFYTNEIGNPQPPKKCFTVAGARPTIASGKNFSNKRALLGAALLLFFALTIGFWILSRSSLRPGRVANSKSIAVLPFENLSDDPDNAYFAEGVQEEILTRLAKIADLKVISRTSTQRYRSAPENLPEIASQLGVANILEGTVQKAAGQVRVNVQLISAQNDSHLWADKFDRNLTDIFAVESEIAGKIATALQAKLSDAEHSALTSHPTDNTEAHELYLRGRFHWNKRTPEAIATAIDYFQNAIGKDPRYAAAYAGLADCYAVLQLNSDMPADQTMPKAKAAALEAIKIDDTSAQGHAALASVKAFYEWDWNGADSESQKAIGLNPNDASIHHRYAIFLSAQGRNGPAIVEIKRAQELDPLSLIINTAYAACLEHARQYDLAIAQSKKVFEIDPNFWVAHFFLGAAYEQKGWHGRALEELSKARNVPGTASEPLSVAGYVYAVSGRKTEALQILEQLKQSAKERYIPPYHFAMIYAGLGETDRVFELLEESFRNRDQALGFGIKAEPRWDRIRSDKRYSDLLRRMSLAQ